MKHEKYSLWRMMHLLKSHESFFVYSGHCWKKLRSPYLTKQINSTGQYLLQQKSFIPTMRNLH